MRVSLLEVPARWGRLTAQLEWIAAQASPAQPTDLLVLPETALTGYVSPAGQFDLTPFAEPLATGAARLKGLAEAFGCDVLGPVVEREGSAVFNTTLGVSPEGEVWLHYRKRHPWFPERWASPGTLPWPIVQRHGLRLSCAVCFDVHFLPEEAAEVLSAVDLLLFPSAWVEAHAGEDQRLGLLRELATGFSVTICNANWGPGSPAVPGQGGSLVARPDGSVQRLRAGAARLELETFGQG
jgi:predicted amidohydrolase